MESIALYLVKSCGLLLLFFIAYHFLLRKETFFTSNRWFLLAGLVTSALLPLLVFTKIIWIEPTSVNYDWSSLPMSAVIEEDHTEEYIYLGLALIYCIAMLSLLAKFGFDFYSLQKVFKGKPIQRQADFKFIDIKENLAPFSFFNTIVYNSALYSTAELESIIEHEKVHSEQHHTIDVLISRLFCVVFWFNPIVWFYKKAILQNLEFIADSEASKKISDKKAYQITLLKITTQENCVAITNHFYQSLIKKRIVMLNKNQSNKRNSWKYASVVPALIAFVFLFQVKVVAQEKVKEEIIKVSSNDHSTANDVLHQEKDSTKKYRTIMVNKAQNKGLDANTEIFIDGKKVTKEEMDNTNPNDISTMNVSKTNYKSTVTIITKKNSLSPESKVWINNKLTEIPDEDKVMVFEQNRNATQLELEKTDPTNLNGVQKPKTTRTITVVKREKDGLTLDTDIYIDGIKSTKKELDLLDPTLISKMDVNKNDSNKKTVTIITKDNKQSSNNNLDITKQPKINDSNEKPILIINGKKANPEVNIDDIDPKTITSVNVLKGKTAVKKYGAQATNGAIEIETKK
ncbi:M56 family metallopeptidase [Flavobacterium frigoris]|uniref:TonB-dependent Receptor Plug Domain n=1 Tax=Flavobacterium frigoris TaxID=229204 RepID=A0A1H9H4T5_FLAFI|nr:M56 family metallopeptidase [Flavobacterium frigoris]SEQ57346.1 TonB-dependent Receptor Plug Domain [Flavobacterium frigoris]